MYYNRIRKFLWIEVNEKAYEVPNECFLSDFDEYDHVPLTDEVYKSIKILLRDKIDYKKLYKIYKQENFRRWCREMEIIAGKTKLNILKGKYKK